MLPQLDHDPAPPHLMRHRTGGAGAGEGVEDEVAGVGGNVNNPMQQSLRLWRFKWLYVWKKLVKVISFCLLIGSHVVG
jgi:hypothetical protein